MYQVYFEFKAKTCLLLEQLGIFLQAKKIRSNEAILIAGSGRSGTTWILNLLAETLEFQPIFEPLNPNFIYQSRRLMNKEKNTEPEVYSPYLRSCASYPEWHSLLDMALTGRVRNFWTDKKRYYLFPKGYIVKMIRANLMLGYIVRNFDPRIIYVLRHPCAVIYSRIKLNWRANLSGLLSQTELIADYLYPYLAEIEKEKDPIGIHAIWWAVEQMIALNTLKDQNALIVHYEDLVRFPNEYFLKIIKWIDYEDNNNDILQTHILTTGSYAVNSSNETRLEKWQNSLSLDQIKKILYWSNRFGIDFYGEQAYPLQSKSTVV